MKVVTTLFTITLLCLGGCAQVIENTAEGPIETREGTRTLGTVVEDKSIETKTLVNMRKASEELKASHLNVTSYNGLVLLTGQVPSENARRLATEVTSQVQKVRRVENQLAVAGPTTALVRSNDVVISTKIRAALMNQLGFDLANRIKVTTEEATVYLLGLVTRTEAEAATQIAQGAFGAKRIVRVFEYID